MKRCDISYTEHKKHYRQYPSGIKHIKTNKREKWKCGSSQQNCMEHKRNRTCVACYHDQSFYCGFKMIYGSKLPFYIIIVLDGWYIDKDLKIVYHRDWYGTNYKNVYKQRIEWLKCARKLNISKDIRLFICKFIF
jgi:hypothetical protein